MHTFNLVPIFSLQVLHLNDHQLHWVCDHLGHTKKVHLQHYRNMSGFIERSQVAKLMLVHDLNLTGEFKGKKLDDARANGE